MPHSLHHICCVLPEQLPIGIRTWVDGGWPGGGGDGGALSGDGGAIPIGERHPAIAAGSPSGLLPPLPVAVYASPAQVAPPDRVGFERGRVRVGPGNVG